VSAPRVTPVVDRRGAAAGAVQRRKRLIIPARHHRRGRSDPWREGSPGLLLRADALGFAEVAVWTEEQVGTNAIGTALAERTPV
jgi:hypothetical protein